ncbi:YifB family Mg chelatase-like AAA ATPase [Demequina sp. TTPB684]|uniref:YifB family Mg chelatase-like AAA ATPase n=1 Tax=unclassified Demequina TaxID=2620311 RepID=UPI001CF59513|nr:MULTISPECIES: YifB family Mg chelatase-like AAA ATPase [unclassified Demequina]MCB2413148.1 YifB family Mg chelatase-like AAA ATPase [Demequina sp. TTPB684]UPU89654.1 YifB family Mg chelatase-like AAA ATPase [Demequina sp. TMPB413]
MIGRTRSVVLTGVRGHVIDVEAHLAASLPAFTLVGLPDASLHEARDRVRAAVASSALAWPQRRITVNLSPASLPKSGSVTDLAIAVAVMAAAGMIVPASAARAVHLGELSLDGQVRPVRGVLPSVIAAVEAGCPHVVVPSANADEASLVPGAEVIAVDSLAQLAALYGNDDARPMARGPAAVKPVEATPSSSAVDLADVRGQTDARWALEVAAAGGHHLLMVGPPGAGKTMLASRLPGILPNMAAADALAATSIHSVAGTLDASMGLLTRPPFEAPHHSASAAAIVGGGARLARPGAISRAHGGVLFLDEAPEFPSAVLQTLRQPLESGEVVLHRAYGATRYPARFQLVLAANPCPCGHYFGGGGKCSCTPMARRRYFARLSGPLLDRIDLQVEVLPVRRAPSLPGEDSASVAVRVDEARQRARRRWTDVPWSGNAQVPSRWLRENTPQSSAAVAQAAMERGRLSARGADRALRVAWTLADLERVSAPTSDHVARAMMLRSRDGGQ